MSCETYNSKMEGLVTNFPVKHHKQLQISALDRFVGLQ